MASIVVYGAGAIGGFVGARLALAGHAVHLVGRPALMAAVQSHGLRLALPDGQTLVAGGGAHGVFAHARLDEALRAVPGARADLLVLAVKSYDTAAALADLQAAGSALPPVLTLQNGVGNEEALAEGLGGTRVIAGIITFPVSVSAPAAVVLERAKGGLGLAAVAGAAPAVPADLLRGSALPVTLYRDYRAMKWSKLMMNMMANAAAAILDRSSAAVMADPRVFALEVAALREAYAVMRALHIPVVALPGYPMPLLALGLRVLPAPLLRPILGPIVGRSRGRKPPSLRLDLARGRSEVEWLNGAVVRYGTQAGVPTPVNRALVETLTRLAARRDEPPGEAWRGVLLGHLAGPL